MYVVDPAYENEELVNPDDLPIEVTDLRDHDGFLEAMERQLDRFGLELVVWEAGDSSLVWSVQAKEAPLTQSSRQSRTYVVYHIRSTMEKRRYSQSRFATTLVRKLGPEYAWATLEDYNTKIVHMVTRRNMRTGVEYQEPSNTPSYCSPSSEAYWSM